MLIIAHRGASAVAPESTAAAINAAVAAAVHMIELDVQMTRDGRLVLFHDARLDRTTNGRGPLRVCRYAQLRRLDAGRWFHPRFAGQRILPASQALRLAPRRIRLNLELKSTARRTALMRRVRRLARGAGPRVCWSSFDLTLVRALARAGLDRVLISRDHPARELRAALRYGCGAWHPSKDSLTRAALAQAHAAGLRVHVWTVDRVREARRLARWGADGIFTNDPARMRRALRGGA